MSELVGLSGLKSFDQFKSSLRSPSAQTSKSFQISSRQPSYSNSSELASAETDLDLANSELKKLSEHICYLEEKLQNAYDECGMLKVKHEEVEKLLKELESKFHRTKTLCDQLTETLQLLSDQAQDAEKDKVLFANKLSESSVALDNMNGQMKSLSLKLESSEETIRIRDKQLEELGICKENIEKELRDEHLIVLNLTNEKDNLIKNFEETVAANELNERKEKENTDLLATNKELTESLDKTMQENQSLENFVKVLTFKLQYMDKQSVVFWEQVIKVNTFFDSCFELLQEEKKLAAQKTQQVFDWLHGQLLNTTSEKDALQLVNQELNNKINELQNDQKDKTAHHAEECRVAEEKFLKLKSEEESLLLKNAEMENLINTLNDKILSLSEASRLSEIQMQDFQLKHSEFETGNKEIINNLQSGIQRKEEEMDNLQKEMVKHEQHGDSLENQLNQLQSLLQEKEQVVLEVKEREKQLQDHFSEAQKLLVEAEGKLAEAKKQYNQMLESKQLELSRHLKEISQRNDQAINVLRNKYETEKQECINLEKKKAEKAVADMEKKCEEKLSECKEEIKQQLLKIERDHTALVAKIPMQLKELRDEHHKVVNLTNDKENLIKNFEETEAANESHIESLNSILNELQFEINSKEDRLNYMHKLNARKEIENTHLIATNKKVSERLHKTMQENHSLENCVKWLTFKLQEKADNELKEKTKLPKNENEAELRELRSQHEEDRKIFEEELNIQKTKRRKTRWI